MLRSPREQDEHSQRHQSAKPQSTRKEMHGVVGFVADPERPLLNGGMADKAETRQKYSGNRQAIHRLHLPESASHDEEGRNQQMPTPDASEAGIEQDRGADVPIKRSRRGSCHPATDQRNEQQRRQERQDGGDEQ